MLIFSLWLTSAVPATACDRNIFIRVWEYSGGLVDRAKRTVDPAPLQVYTFRGVGKLSHETFEVFQRTLFEKAPLTEADRELLERENVGNLYRSLKAAPEWVRNANLAIGAYRRNHLIPESELGKANEEILKEIPALMKRLHIGHLIYKAHYYGDQLFLTKGDHAQLKQAGVTEAELRELANEQAGRKFSDYDELRKEWEDALSAKRKHMLKTYAKAPLHLARMLLLMPDVVTDYKTKKLRDRLLENPDHEFQSPEGILGWLKAAVPFTKGPHFDEKAFSRKMANLQALRDEVRANPKLYQNAAQVESAINLAMRMLVLGALLALKYGLDDKTLDESFDLEGPDGMSRDDADNGIVELIHYPDSHEAAIRLGGKVYHYGYNAMERIDSLPVYEPLARAKGDHIRIRLKLTQEEIKKLREKLEDERNRKYMGVAPYNTAPGQANQDLRQATGIGIPSIVDRTHSTAVPLMQLRNLTESMGLTQDRVQKIIYASDGGHGRDLPSLATDGLEAAWVSSLPWKSLVILPLFEQLPQGKRDESKIVKREEKSVDEYIEGVKARAKTVKTWDQYFEALETWDKFSFDIMDAGFDRKEANRLQEEDEAREATRQKQKKPAVSRPPASGK